MLAEIACFVNRLVSRYYSNTPQNTEGEPALEKRQGLGTPKFHIRGWATRPGPPAREKIRGWSASIPYVDPGHKVHLKSPSLQGTEDWGTQKFKVKGRAPRPPFRIVAVGCYRVVVFAGRSSLGMFHS